MDERYTKRQKKIIQMEQLREVDKLTLQEIGDRFGISRERVRQLIGNTGRRNMKKYLIDDADMLRDELYVNETTTVDKIAKKYRISRQAVSRILGPRWKYLLGLGLRKCYRCGQIKTVDQFGRSDSRYKNVTLSGTCKECNNANSKRYYQIRAKKSKQARAAKRSQKAAA